MPSARSPIPCRVRAALRCCLSVLASSAVIALAGAALATPAGAQTISVGRLFSARSVWNAALSPTTPMSGARGPEQGLRASVFAEISGGYGPWVNTYQYSTPLYTVSGGQRRVPVTITASWGGALQQALKAGVPVPGDAVPAAGSDAEITIYQPSSDTLWEFWQMRRQGRGWAASWGGVMPHVSRNPGYYLDQGAPGASGFEQSGWGATATSLPAIAGTILPREILSGQIDHALAMAVPNTCGGWWLWPAQRTDGGSSASDCVPEGAHFRIGTGVDLASLGLPPLTLMLARAAQRYGVIVRDTAPEVEFYGLDTTHTGGAHGAFAPPPWDYMPQFPWSDLALVSAPRCTRTPCARPTASVRARRALTRRHHPRA